MNVKVSSDRSIIAQTYLELLRTWTMNTQERWLFECVDSAGICMHNSFSAPILSAFSYPPLRPPTAASKTAALSAIKGGDGYFRTRDSPNEKETILKRMQARQAHGLTDMSFTKYEHIICFGERTPGMLQKFKDAVAAEGKKVKAEITHIKETDWYKPADEFTNAGKDNLQKVCGQLKTALKRFVKVQFNWEKPNPGIADGEWRTAMLVVPKVVRDKIGKDEWALKKKVWEKKGCRVNAGVEAKDMWLLAISGPLNKLEGARKMILE